MKLGIRSKLFFVSLGLVAISLAVANAYLARAISTETTERIRRELLVRLRLIERSASTDQVALDDLPRWDALADDFGRRAQGRVTLVRADGVVLGDSEVDLAELASVENHAGRPEVAFALTGSDGAATRYSDTVQRRMLYAAVPFRREGRIAGVARLACPLTEVDLALGQMRRNLFLASALTLLVAILVSSIAARKLSSGVLALTRAARRLASGDLDVRTRPKGRDEVAELGRALDQLATNLKDALAELRTERDRMSRVLDGMREGVLLLDEQGKVELVNPALREMLLLGGDVLGKTALETVRNAELKRILDSAADGGTPASGEVELGEIRPRQLLVHAIRLPDELGGLLAVFVDVTDLRRLESLRRDFVANVSHELRTPITAVRTAAETLRGAVASGTDAALTFVDIIERNAGRLQRLVEDLLDLSRIEAREVRLSLEPVDVRTVVEHVMGSLRPHAERRHVRLVNEVEAGAHPVRAARDALEQVLVNLIDNAIKYGKEHGTVRVQVEGGTRTVRIVVTDEGPGVEEKHLPRLFERFYRVDAGRSRELGGTGLGLSIVKHLAEAMAGSVSVESTPGVGSRFSVTLPRA